MLCLLEGRLTCSVNIILLHALSLASSFYLPAFFFFYDGLELNPWIIRITSGSQQFFLKMCAIQFAYLLKIWSRWISFHLHFLKPLQFLPYLTTLPLSNILHHHYFKLTMFLIHPSLFFMEIICFSGRNDGDDFKDKKFLISIFMVTNTQMIKIGSVFTKNLLLAIGALQLNVWLCS